MKVICISGKAGYGKDFTAKKIKEKLEENGYKVLITHYADLLKYICKSFFSWDGVKNEEGRSILQTVGTNTIRNKCPDYWVKFIVEILNFFPDEWDYVLIPDTRFENEISIISEQFNTISLRVERPDYVNSLTEEQQKHESEVALDNYTFDYTLINSGNNSYSQNISDFINWILER